MDKGCLSEADSEALFQEFEKRLSELYEGRSITDIALKELSQVYVDVVDNFNFSDDSCDEVKAKVDIDVFDKFVTSIEVVRVSNETVMGDSQNSVKPVGFMGGDNGRN